MPEHVRTFETDDPQTLRSPELLVVGVDALADWFVDDHLQRAESWRWLFDRLYEGEAGKLPLNSVGHYPREDRYVGPEEGGPHTGPNWASQYTGVTPDEHGLTDQGWKTEQLGYADIQTRTIFDQLSMTNYTQAVYNMPITHPAPQMDGGWCVSGFPAPLPQGGADPVDLGVVSPELATSAVREEASRPRSLLHIRDELPRNDIRYLDEWGRTLTDGEAQEVVDALLELELAKADRFLELYAQASTDVAYFGTTAIDKICHTFGADPANKHVRATHLAVGAAIRRLVQALDPANIVVTSDHGFKEGETDHDSTGVFMWDIANSAVDRDLREQSELNMTDVATYLSYILGIGDGWIGQPRDAPDSDAVDPDAIRDRLEQLGYLD